MSHIECKPPVTGEEPLISILAYTNALAALLIEKWNIS